MKEDRCPYCMRPLQGASPCLACGEEPSSYEPLPHHLLPGTSLADRYVLGRVLGEGGFGITYLGWDTALDRWVAVKEYYPHDQVVRSAHESLAVTRIAGASAEGFETGRNKFLEEARALAKMSKQPCVVDVYDKPFEENGTAYIVMEYVEGISLSRLAEERGGRIEPDELFEMVEPLLRALAELHEEGIIHRDVTPDNVLLENGQIRLIDFGCARAGTRGTREMTVMLKDGYAPVEQYNNWGQGTWTNVYSLCATLYKALTGVTPPLSVERSPVDELVPPSQLGVDLGLQREEAILRGLRVKPGRRYRTMDALWEALYGGPSPVKKSRWHLAERLNQPA